MNKKSVILFFSVFVLLSLSVFYATGDLDNLFVGDNVTYKIGDAYNVSNWVTNIPVTINLTATIGPLFTSNVTNVTFILDANGGSTAPNISWGIVDNEGVYLTQNVADGELFGGDVENNFTYLDGVFAGWNCTNASNTIDCYNTSDSSLNTIANSTFTVTVNITAISANDDEEDLNFSVGIAVAGEASEVIGFDNATDATLYIDTQKPRLVEVNITDGNTTYHNASWSAGHIISNGALTIAALLEDSRLESTVVLGYNCNDTNGSFHETTDGGWQTETVGTVTNVNAVGTVDHRAYISYSIPPACFSNIDPDADGNGTITFAFLTNDTFNQKIVLNGTGDGTAVVPFNISVDDGEVLPLINNVNVTQTAVGLMDGTSTSKTLSQGSPLDGTSDYLKDNTATFDIEITGGYKPTSVLIMWNDTGAGTTALAPAVIGGDGVIFPAISNLAEAAALNATNITQGAGFAGDSGPQNVTTGTVYRATLDLSGNNSHDFAFWVVANSTGDNYTRIGGPYRFIVDGGAPEVTLTPPTDRTISPRGSITYTCKGTESGGSGVSYIMWQFKKPGEATWTTKQNYEAVSTDNTDTVTFSEGDTNLAGTYDLKCYVVDGVGNEGSHASTSSETFSVHYSTTGAGAAEGPSAAADIDLSIQEEVTVREKQGTISTFTLDGVTIHKITIKEINELLGTVTIFIESDPITVTLKIGEMKEVDVDADGEDDISVTLNSITDGVADITTKRLTPLPEKVPTEEVPPTEAPEEMPPTEEAPSKAWLWILIIVIIVVIGIGYWFMKKKK